jgi:hypothetical protein
MFMSQKKDYFPPVVLLLGLLSLAACASTGSSPGDGASPKVSPKNTQTGAASPLASFSQEIKIPLWETPYRGNDPALTISLALIDLSGTADSGEKAALQRLFQDTWYRGQSPQDYTRETVRVQSDEYRDMGEAARDNPSIAGSPTLNRSYEERFETEVNTPRLLVVSRTRSIYTGDAHPNHDKTYFVFDREVAMLVHLSDLIRTEARPMLKVLMNRYLRVAKKLGSNDSLRRADFFVDEAELTENFFLSPQGLGFHWDPYEIASYAEGFVEALIPYGEIKNFLSPEGLRLAQEFGTIQ